MIPVPDLDGPSVAFGCIKHMPKSQEVPEEFKDHDNPYAKVVGLWFFKGLDKNTLKAKEGVDKEKALQALYAIICSWEPKHEHKVAGAAYLMSQWFDISDAA